MSGGMWPVGRIDRIQRLRVLGAGLAGAAVVETRIEAGFDEVWGWVADLERSVPAFDRDVARLRVLKREDQGAGHERLIIRTSSSGRALWVPLVHEVDLAPGWCWMVSRPQVYVVGMAAEPDGDGGTRFALLEGVALALPRALRPLLAVSRWRHRRHILHDIAGIQQRF